jgi:RNA polymerase sigma-70 factor (ECF subfamily)
MIVEACLSGDTAAFGTLVDSYSSKLFNVALQITGSREDAMDVTQSAFAKAYEKLDSFDPSFRFFSWIYRIAINEAINLTKRQRREPTLEVAAVSTATNPEEKLGQAEAKRSVQRALAGLTAEYRSVVVLKHLQGLSYREISELLEIPEKTVKSRLFSARQRLRTLLLGQGVAR